LICSATSGVSPVYGGYQNVMDCMFQEELYFP
jgi:hypothetical protein